MGLVKSLRAVVLIEGPEGKALGTLRFDMGEKGGTKAEPLRERCNVEVVERDFFVFVVDRSKTGHAVLLCDSDPDL